MSGHNRVTDRKELSETGMQVVDQESEHHRSAACMTRDQESRMRAGDQISRECIRAVGVRENTRHGKKHCR